MNGFEKRKERLKTQIKEAALILFKEQGVKTLR